MPGARCTKEHMVKQISSFNSKFRLNGWQRIGICLSLIYLTGLHVLVFIDSKSPPNSSETNPFESKIKTTFFEWSISSSPPRSEEQYRKEKGFPADHKLTAEELWDLIPDKWVRSFRFTTYLSLVFIPLLFGWGFIYLLVWTVKWVIRGFKNKE